MKTLLVKKINAQKSIVWFSAYNRYAVFPSPTANMLHLLSEGNSPLEIGESLVEELDLPYQRTIDFVTDVKQQIYIPNTTKKSVCKKQKEAKADVNYKIIKFYKINETVFKVSFQTEQEAFWIHPKFAHLETEPQQKTSTHYQVYSKDNHTFLFVDNLYVGSWALEDIHFFQGKFSMELVQKIHNKKEKEWLGVFHASAVANQEHSVLLLGDSGNGKSTSLALLQANGFTCLADDFVPVDAKKQEVYSFPSAISVKKNSIPVLLDYYPELKKLCEYHLKLHNKTVRYLPLNSSNYKQHLPCKALIFIKYQPDISLKLGHISILDAFERLVPDSWLSPEPKNAKAFLDWVVKLPCYEIVYSDNKKMIETITKLFNEL